MARVAYVNGRYQPLGGAQIGIEDRGNQFADGIYEVIKFLGGRLRDLDRHLDRLERSLAELAIAMPLSRRALVAVIDETRRRNRLNEGIVYIQISRGQAPRNHLFPDGARPSLTITVRRAAWPASHEFEDGVGVITLPDQRWGRCDIKSISLLANILAKQQAHRRGCREAWLIGGDGQITEGSSSNAYIVDRDGRLVTHPLGPRILGGITRQVTLELARSAQIEVQERPFTLDEAGVASEAMLTSTTSWLLPVTRIDGSPVGDGRPGPTIRRLMELYESHIQLT